MSDQIRSPSCYDVSDQTINKGIQNSIFLKFFYEMEDKIILKFKPKNILNFYEIEPRVYFAWDSIRFSQVLSTKIYTDALTKVSYYK